MSTIVVSDWASFITAVGTPGAYVEFPKNLVKTTDTDVNPNKLYTDANGVVQTNVQPSDLVNLYENTFTLDANSQDGFPEGLTTSIAIDCASINGYGGTIINLASDSVVILTVPSGINITGIAILNVSCKNCNFIDSYWSDAEGTIQKCLFSGRIEGDGGDYFFNSRHMTLTSCGIKVQLYAQSYFAYYNFSNGYPQFRYCRIETEDHRTISGEETVNANNSYWTGNFNLSLKGTMSTIDYTVFDVTCPAIDAMNNSVAAKMFVNSDKCSSVASRCVSVTTANLQSASDLAALGFPIQM